MSRTKPKYIFVVGGVMSGVGKGVAAAALRPRGAILSNEEVSICGEIISFARTFFENPPAH